jgi:hypothetical protein
MKRSCTYAAVCLSVFLSACASTPSVSYETRPAWIDNPGEGVSASAGMHVRGKAAQEELAISRARVEYAKRFGVSIDAVGVYAKNMTNGHSVTTGELVSQERTQQTDVKAMVKAKWHDEDADVLWVWLVPGN